MRLSKIYLTLIFIVIFLITGMFSCTKKNESTDQENIQNGEVEEKVIDEGDLTENDEDLLSVDYREFYDALSPHGEWIEVTGEEIGVELKKETSSTDSPHRTISIYELFGIKNVYADDVSFGAFFIWKPAPELAVTVAAGEPAPVYMPYSNGEWVYTDAGWYFKAPTPHEEICHHHGRWVYSPSLGWVWMPGRVWAPAWVDWRENDTYIAWTPVPPGIYIYNNSLGSFPFYEERCIVVEKRHFIEPGVYKYMYKENKNKIMIKEWRRIDGVMVMNKTVINKGPDVKYISKVSGKEIHTVKINKVKSIKDVKYSGSEIETYSPGFKKVKGSGNDKKVKIKPDKYVGYNDVKDKGSNKKHDITGESDKSRGKNKTESGEELKGKDKGKVKTDDNSKGNKKKEDNSKVKDDKKQDKNKGKEKNMKDGNKQKEDKGSRDKGKGKNK